MTGDDEDKVAGSSGIKELRRDAELALRVMDAEHLDLPDASFDAVICRLGFMFLPNLHTALTGMRRILKPGGRVAAMVFSIPENNPSFALPVSIIRRRAHLPPPVPGRPGPFSLGGPGVLADAYLWAGFHDPTIRALDAPLRMPSAGQLLKDITRDELNRLLKIEHITPAGRSTLRVVLDAAKDYYADGSRAQAVDDAVSRQSPGD